MLKSYYYEDNRYWTKYLTNLFGKKIFENPKSVNLIIKLLNFTSSDNSIILDFFSGSATTAHAVMQLNAEDGGSRKFIMVQLPEETDPKSEAYKAGYKNICEIGKERIRRAGKKIEEDLNAKSIEGDLFDEKESKTLDTGFRVLKVDSSNMKDVYYSPSEYNQQLLLELESNIKEDRTDIDLLYGVLLDWGVPLSLPHITEKIDGKDVHFVNDTDLVACFEEHVPEEVIREIAKRKPLRVVFRDSSFHNSPDKINVTEIFKTLSPETTIKVI
jgi:adenine-specific DNA-methyltransferase